MFYPIKVRDAAEADLPVLTAIKGEGSEGVHLDRLRDSREAGFRYLVLVAGQEVIGFGCLVFVRPAQWSDADDTEHLPQMVDIQVRDSWRGQGYGSQFIGALEQLAAEAGYSRLYLSVEPLENSGAYRLYQRLGYQALQAQPYRKAWSFTDSQGSVHNGVDWVVDMVKSLTVPYVYRDGYLEAVMFLFYENGRILVEHRLEKDPPEPFIPNGKIERRDQADAGDYREAAVRREISEEFSGHVSPQKITLLGEYSVEPIKTIFYIYQVNLWQGEIPAYSMEEGEKSAELEWVEVEAAKKLFYFPVLHYAVQLLQAAQPHS